MRITIEAYTLLSLIVKASEKLFGKFVKTMGECSRAIKEVLNLKITTNGDCFLCNDRVLLYTVKPHDPFNELQKHVEYICNGLRSWFIYLLYRGM